MVRGCQGGLARVLSYSGKLVVMRCLAKTKLTMQTTVRATEAAVWRRLQVVLDLPPTEVGQFIDVLVDLKKVMASASVSGDDDEEAPWSLLGEDEEDEDGDDDDAVATGTYGGLDPAAGVDQPPVGDLEELFL